MRMQEGMEGGREGRKEVTDTNDSERGQQDCWIAKCVASGCLSSLHHKQGREGGREG